MKSTAYYIKSSILMALLLVESFFLTRCLISYVSSGDYFTPPVKTLITITVLLLILLYTYSLTVGGWGKWEQFVIVPIPISLGIFAVTALVNSSYAILVSVVALLLLCYDMFVASKINSQFLVFNPRMILKFSSKGMLFLFALLAAVMAFVLPSSKLHDFNLGGKVGKMVQEQVDKYVPNSGSFVGELPAINLDFEDTVTHEFNKIIEPYRQFIPPLIALIVFALIRFLGSIANLAFNLTITPVFFFLKKVGFLNIKTVQAQKEYISFESSTE